MFSKKSANSRPWEFRFDKPEENVVKERFAWLAVLLNLLFPGLGFLYLGRLLVAVFYPLFLYAILAGGALSQTLFQPAGFYLIAGSLLVTWLAGVIGVGFWAAKINEVRVRKYQRWYGYLLFIVLVTLASDFYISNRGQYFGYETFRLASISMKDTLHAGDFILVDTFKYQSAEPQRGDIVVFRLPEEPEKKYAKRIIGLPGEQVSFKDGKVFINGKLLRESYIDERYLEFSRNDKPKKYKVPAGQFFVLGDNRDNSNDSRFWGFLPKHNILGKAELIWFFYDSKSGIRTDRIGNPISPILSY